MRIVVWSRRSRRTAEPGFRRPRAATPEAAGRADRDVGRPVLGVDLDLLDGDPRRALVVRHAHGDEVLDRRSRSSSTRTGGRIVELRRPRRGPRPSRVIDPSWSVPNVLKLSAEAPTRAVALPEIAAVRERDSRWRRRDRDHLARNRRPAPRVRHPDADSVRPGHEAGRRDGSGSTGGSRRRRRRCPTRSETMSAGSRLALIWTVSPARGCCGVRCERSAAPAAGRAQRNGHVPRRSPCRRCP